MYQTILKSMLKITLLYRKYLQFMYMKMRHREVRKFPWVTLLEMVELELKPHQPCSRGHPLTIRLCWLARESGAPLWREVMGA